MLAFEQVDNVLVPRCHGGTEFQKNRARYRLV